MTIIRFFKKHKKKFIFLIIIGIMMVYGIWSMRPKPVVYDYATVVRRDIIQEVSVTGRVTPSEDVSLAFQTGGRVSRTFGKVGDTVVEGAVIAELQKADLLANLEQANARVDAERARLNQLKEGTRPEEIDVQKVRVLNAELAYENVKKNVITMTSDLYTKTDDIVRNKIDRFFTNPRSSNPQLVFIMNDLQSQTYLEASRVNLEKMLETWKTENLSMQDSFNSALVAEAKNHLIETRVFLDRVALGLTSAITTTTVTQTMIDGYKTDVSLARTIINSALSSLETQTDTLSSSKSTVDLEISGLALKNAPTLPQSINAQMAVVEQMKANVLSIEADIQKTILRSPMSGIITKQDAKAGEIVSPGVPVVSIISKDKLLIEAFIPEADIAKITLGDVAKVTLDAYGDTVLFSATAISVDPAETILEGVATYKMKFQFREDDIRIKPGMTANIDIKTAENKSTLSLPQRILIRKANEVFVQILEGEVVKEIPIVSGLRGSDGNTEILSGLKEGQKVIVPKN